MPLDDTLEAAIRKALNDAVAKETSDAQKVKKLAEQKYCAAKAIEAEAKKLTSDFKKSVAAETVKLNERINTMSIEAKARDRMITDLRSTNASLVADNEKMKAKLDAIPEPVKEMAAK
jgi:hypothetical protein